MAEGRMLKKAISTSRRLADLKTDSARMLYTWIIPHLDVEGRFYADPSMIKGSVVPRIKSFTEGKISECLVDMAEVGLINLYTIDGDQYLYLRKFEDHQNIKKDREAASKIPAPDITTPDQIPQTPDKLLTNSRDCDPSRARAEVKIREDKISKEKGARAIPPSKMKFLDSVFLTASEHEKLKEAIGQKNLEIGIEKLDYSITVKGGKYKDHHKTILNWNKRGFLKGNGAKPAPQGGERDIRDYVPEEREEITEDQRQENIKRAKGLIDMVARSSP